MWPCQSLALRIFLCIASYSHTLIDFVFRFALMPRWIVLNLQTCRKIYVLHANNQPMMIYDNQPTDMWQHLMFCNWYLLYAAYAAAMLSSVTLRASQVSFERFCSDAQAQSLVTPEVLLLPWSKPSNWTRVVHCQLGTFLFSVFVMICEGKSLLKLWVETVEAVLDQHLHFAFFSQSVGQQLWMAFNQQRYMVHDVLCEAWITTRSLVIVWELCMSYVY